MLVRAHCGARNLDLGRAKQPFTGRQVTVERVALDVVHLGGMHQGADGSELRDVSRGRDRIDEMEVDAGVHGHGVDVAGDTWVAGRIARGVPDSRARLCRRTAPRDGRRRNGNGATIIADRARIAECVDGLIDASLSTRGNPRVWEVSTGKPLGELKGLTGLADSGVLSPDGTTVLTADTNRNGAIWDAQTGNVRTAAVGHVLAAAFDDDGGPHRAWDRGACARRRERGAKGLHVHPGVRPIARRANREIREVT